jgi:hypothetical protein
MPDTLTVTFDSYPRPTRLSRIEKRRVILAVLVKLEGALELTSDIQLHVHIHTEDGNLFNHLLAA